MGAACNEPTATTELGVVFQGRKCKWLWEHRGAPSKCSGEERKPWIFLKEVLRMSDLSFCFKEDSPTWFLFGTKKHRKECSACFSSYNFTFDKGRKDLLLPTFSHPVTCICESLRAGKASQPLGKTPPTLNSLCSQGVETDSVFYLIKLQPNHGSHSLPPSLFLFVNFGGFNLPCSKIVRENSA